jgi:hypothetical protein
MNPQLQNICEILKELGYSGSGAPTPPVEALLKACEALAVQADSDAHARTVLEAVAKILKGGS